MSVLAANCRMFARRTIRVLTTVPRAPPNQWSCQQRHPTRQVMPFRCPLFARSLTK